MTFPLQQYEELSRLQQENAQLRANNHQLEVIVEEQKRKIFNLIMASNRLGGQLVEEPRGSS